MPNVTLFDTRARYIFLPIFITTKSGKKIELDAILDSGAPNTELSDQALERAGFLDTIKKDVQLKPGLQTQKYGKVSLPQIEICSHPVNNLEVYVSHFEKSWGVDALIGLDFFKRFRVTVDYKAGHLITAPL
ncbi:MAG: hypothetical protein A2W61_07650 [Deltaproteobacteria bacterium RIFCSPLOWO2_01_44_7]|nr:MAG: hypothetical protein A2712_04320 [Deltaproteobacteria bacterium RIFCSPHIGHO2_01_FULL_43_49]OGQ16409.1 MAG: hypothetical protein A3D22_02285 [Deltaproteobacteria bacterium RIFCSPHIGHO2_02_FULL_44_53]OGQ27764.1 MAG: hypothetical protein A3D98_08700 [Deltaproteobacteria bacterium RIFCSPHIGHO2_12_FULL_44_21]OGQ32927.1 MAG: hypothetical protein A2979_10215 [Deltaproteobacteria bacterium RIFCSPLOWO2_01_FULL_45_74]OGQ38700.1 MAG: hypothetical protein A2W61_07650 [Deltaproteobacteria bacterium 